MLDHAVQRGPVESVPKAKTSPARGADPLPVVSFVESAVNQIVSKRFAKKQQMQWTKKSVHLVLQMRTQVLDERLEDTFRDWYPDFRRKPRDDAFKQAA